MPNTRVNATLLSFNNKAYLYGGECKSQFVDIMTLNLNTYRWEKVALPIDMCPEKRVGELVLAHGNLILVHGGSAPYLTAINERMCYQTMYMFDTVKRTWSHVSPKGVDPTPRRYHGGSVIGHKMVIYGG
jgi:hypothetical protein